MKKKTLGFVVLRTVSSSLSTGNQSASPLTLSKGWWGWCRHVPIVLTSDDFQSRNLQKKCFLNNFIFLTNCNASWTESALRRGGKVSPQLFLAQIFIVIKHGFNVMNKTFKRKLTEEALMKQMRKSMKPLHSRCVRTTGRGQRWALQDAEGSCTAASTDDVVG